MRAMPAAPGLAPPFSELPSVGGWVMAKKLSSTLGPGARSLLSADASAATACS